MHCTQVLHTKEETTLTITKAQRTQTIAGIEKARDLLKVSVTTDGPSATGSAMFQRELLQPMMRLLILLKEEHCSMLYRRWCS